LSERHAAVLLRYAGAVIAAQGDAVDRELLAAQHALAEGLAANRAAPLATRGTRAFWLNIQ
jgi:hypothetical protein